MNDPSMAEILASADLLLIMGRFVSSPARQCSRDLSVDPSDLDLLTRLAADEDRTRLHDALAAAALHAAPPAGDPAWQAEYTRLFDGAVSCPINETAYVRRDKGVIIADLCGFYEAFGFQRDEAWGEKPDHLVCELEFAAVLLVMLAQAHRLGDTEGAEITKDALRSFLLEHLAEWIALFRDRLVGTTNLPFYVRVAAALRLGWDAIARRFDLPISDALDAVGVELEDEGDATPYECGMADAEPGQPDLVTLTGPPGTDLPTQ